MSDLPVRTRFYTLLLVLIAAAAHVVAWRQFGQPLDTRQLITAGIVLAMILLAEVLDVSLPPSVITFHVSVSAAFCFAAGLTAGPVLGGIVVALANLIDGIYVRREWIKTTVNSFGLALSTVVSGAVYLALADPGRSPLGSYQNLLAVTLAAVVYTLINSGSLALIVSPILGMGPFQMWRANFGGLYRELITVVTLGSLIPVLVAENQIAIVLLIVPLLLGPHLAFKAIRQAHHETRIAMEGLADALERRDPYTSQHSRRVTANVRVILGLMPNLPRPTAEAIAAAAHVHDLGKVGARDSSLKKPSALSEAERAEMQAHAAIGADIVSRLEAYKPSVETIRHHHERWDGSGYPDGLAGERIPLGARIIAVADAFDAMTSDRVYRAALPTAVALAELDAGAGAQFDPQIVALFHRAYAEGLLLPGKQPAPDGAAWPPDDGPPPPLTGSAAGPPLAAAVEVDLVETGGRGPRR